VSCSSWVVSTVFYGTFSKISRQIKINMNGGEGVYNFERVWMNN